MWSAYSDDLCAYAFEWMKTGDGSIWYEKFQALKKCEKYTDIWY
jgi:hypothetical protein